MDLANTAMKNIGLDSDMMKEVIFFVLSTQTTQDAQEEFQTFLHEVSPALRNNLLDEIFSLTVRKNEIIKLIMYQEPLQNSEAFINTLSKKLDIMLASPENEIVKQGIEDHEGMFFIQSGECNVVVQDKIGLESGVRQVRSLYGGDHFGEISMLYNCRRSATVIASNYCTLARLSPGDFKDIASKYP